MICHLPHCSYFTATRLQYRQQGPAGPWPASPETKAPSALLWQRGRVRHAVHPCCFSCRVTNTPQNSPSMLAGPGTCLLFPARPACWNPCCDGLTAVATASRLRKPSLFRPPMPLYRTQLSIHELQYVLACPGSSKKKEGGQPLPALMRFDCRVQARTNGVPGQPWDATP